MSPVPPPNTAIAELASALGDDSARELVDMYLSSFEAMLRDLKCSDFDQRKRAAHSLKSSSRIVGATALSNRMADLEARLTNSRGDITPDDLTATVADFEQIAVPLRAYSRKPGA
jgi:HPt (histidine-containing phosphotransfer) domain-containing protein